MKRTKSMLLAAALGCLAALALFSCSNGLLKDPRLYNAKKKSAGGDSAITVAPEPELDLTGGVDPFDNLDEWYNKSTEGFPHTDFDQMSLEKTFFDKRNVPIYAMKSGDVWVSKDVAKAEFVHAKAPNTEGQGYEIKNVHWYQYRGRNPLYAADGSYNTSLQSTSNGNPKLNRFYFYRFTGDTLSPSLDNFLFAVDTYSKLMFAFAYPTKTEAVFGNNVPKAWGPTDGEAYKDGTVYQFYMYDPVGYVTKENGNYTVVMYKWFEENLAKGIYAPTLGEAGGDVAKKTTDGAGKSPFNNHDVDNFLINMQLFAGRTFMYREKTSGGGNSLRKIIYVISEDGTTLTKKTEVWNGVEDTPADVVYTIGKDEHSTATKGVISGGDDSLSGFEIKDEGKTIVFNNGITATTTFQDYGPDWLERVKHNPVYQTENSNTTYTFSNDGRTLRFEDKAEGYDYTYTFVQQYDDNVRNRAVYKTDDGWAGFGHAGFWLYEHDFFIEVTKRSAAGAWAVDWSMGYRTPLKQEKKGSFTENVKGKTFSLRERDNAGLYDVDLLSYYFDPDGKATFTRTPWNLTPVESIDYTVADGGDGNTGTVNSQQATLDTSSTPWTLTIGDKIYTMGYSDPGPSFLNRVKGATYSRDETKYTFSEDGKELTMEYKKFGTISSFPYLGYYIETKKYTYDPSKDNDVGNQFANYGGFRVQLTKNDTVINMATVPNVGGASVMEYGADRQ